VQIATRRELVQMPYHREHIDTLNCTKCCYYSCSTVQK